jgi:hypothetical protein
MEKRVGVFFIDTPWGLFYKIFIFLIESVVFMESVVFIESVVLTRG